MKITANHSPTIQNEAYLKNRGKEQTPATAIGGTSPAARETDSIVLSQAARELQAAQETMVSLPDVRQEKIARIKAQLQNGSYRPDPAKIATGMITASVVNVHA